MHVCMCVCVCVCVYIYIYIYISPVCIDLYIDIRYLVVGVLL